MEGDDLRSKFSYSQISTEFLAQKTPKPEQNSQEAEILKMGTVEYVFQYSQTFLKSLHILIPLVPCISQKKAKNYIFQTPL